MSSRYSLLLEHFPAGFSLISFLQSLIHLKKTLKLDWLQLWPEESRKGKIRLERSRKRDGGNFNPDRAQNSDTDTSQRQKSNTAEKDYGEKSNSASAQEAPVHIDSQKRSNPNAQPLSDHFGTTNLRRQKSPFGCEYRISAMKVPVPQCVKEKTPWRASTGVRWPYRSAYRCSKRFMLARTLS